MQVFDAYHGKSAEEYQRRFDDLSARGYRMISISVYGPPQNARYAAVWVQRSGPQFVAFHGRSAADYQALVDSLTPQGYAPVLLSATGGGGSEIFAGVFERSGVVWRARHGITAADLDAENAAAAGAGLVMRELCCYGNSGDPRFAAIWHENSSNLHISWWRGFDGAGYQQLFNAVTGAGNRPYRVAVSEGPRYHAIFQDDPLGAWTARHGINEGEYQREFDENLRQGRMPISVRAFGHTSSAADDVYAAVFAEDDREKSRQWIATGARQPQFDPVEALIEALMRKHRIRAASLAVVRNNESRCSRGFTLAEEGYAVTQPDSLFRLASLSKLFAAAAIPAAYSRPRRTSWRRVRIFPLLGITAARLAGQTPDARTNTITLGQIADHQGGWDWDKARPSLHPTDPLRFDPCSGPALRLMARDLGLSNIVSKLDIASYMFGEPLQFAPGTAPQFVYSNFGYLLLGLAVERKTGRPFLDFLRDAVLTPIGVTDVFVADTMHARPREVRYHSAEAALSVYAPQQDSAWVSGPYGGLSTETTDSSGGLLASAPAVARTIAHHAVWGVGARAAGLARIGNMSGSFTCASSRANGYDYAVLFNGNDGLTDAIRGQFLSDANGAIDRLI